MSSKDVRNMLNNYEPLNEIEEKYKKQIISFINKHNNILGDKNTDGHITGSAWIVNQKRNKVLLHHHVVFDKWLQLGGHTEENEDVKLAALREAKEESGLTSLKFLKDKIFDIDIHKIPAGEKKQEHYHYDIRFILEGDESEKLKMTHESRDLKWINIYKIKRYSQEDSILRMVEKTFRYIQI
ncbi:MAG: NUDIX hydrolase [Nanoarchaeota archaeon]